MLAASRLCFSNSYFSFLSIKYTFGSTVTSHIKHYSHLTDSRIRTDLRPRLCFYGSGSRLWWTAQATYLLGWQTTCTYTWRDERKVQLAWTGPKHMFTTKSSANGLTLVEGTVCGLKAGAVPVQWRKDNKRAVLGTSPSPRLCICAVSSNRSITRDAWEISMPLGMLAQVGTLGGSGRRWVGRRPCQVYSCLGNCFCK